MLDRAWKSEEPLEWKTYCIDTYVSRLADVQFCVAQTARKSAFICILTHNCIALSTTEKKLLMHV